jgi:2-polyprenyl-3-methyl-5-hydroxy-6-metoxy-1,4-benzoquinol methylase
MGKKLKRCVVCEGKGFSNYSNGIIQCDNCTLVVASDIPTAEEVDELYQKEYFFGMEYFDYEADRPALEYNFKKRIKGLGKMLRPNYSIVEVGCAYGYFLNLVNGKVKNHIGFDVSKEGVEYAKKTLKANASNEDFLKHKFEPESVDSVFMWDVVEHLAYPDDYIMKIAAILKPGGRVAITTGNIDALVPRIRKGSWRMIHPPTHVYYFSAKTLGKLLEKHGFMVERVKHRSVSRNVGSVFNQIIGNRKALNKNTKLLELGHRLATLLKLHKINIPINTFDIMEMVAVKQ